LHGAIDDGCDIGGLAARLERAGEIEEPRDKRVGPVDFAADDSGEFLRHGVVLRHGTLEQVRRSLNAAQRIAQFVGETGRELPERGQSFRTPHRRLCCQ